MKILGLDPGYGITGWGAVECGAPLRSVAYGVLRTDANHTMAERLWQLQRETIRLLEELRPDVVSVEKLFFSRNTTTAEGVYEARGVLLSSAAGAGIPVLEFAPVVVKQAVTGSGKASKRDVILMVMRQLGIREKISPDDAADGLALAITACAARGGSFTETGKKTTGRGGSL